MEPISRKAYNDNFTAEKYRLFLEKLNEGLPNPIPFRVAETPVFLTEDIRDKLINAGNEIVDAILHPDFKQLTTRAIPVKWQVANENGHPHFITLDFAICKDASGSMVPKLIELQGFPSLFGFQQSLGENFSSCFGIAENQSVYFNGLNKTSYLDLLKRTIIGGCKAEEVVLMDVNAPKQKTSVDFYLTQKYIGIPIVSLSHLKKDGNRLYYQYNGEKKPIKRIYNRLIFDEIDNDPDVFDKVIDIRQPLDVEWITHPNWFYRISKYTMPFLKGDFVPKTEFLDKIDEFPNDLENYVLKPLFSFAGQGVIIDVTRHDIVNIEDPENWILQEKVTYEPVIEAPDGGVKVEIRLLYLWPNGDEKPTLAINLARLSRGKMIGTRFNQDLDWVGGTVAFLPV